MPGHRKRRQFKQTDAFTRGMVIGLKRAGWSIRQIAADTHLGASTVHRLWRRWLEQGNVAIYRNVGATRVTSARVDQRILRQAVTAPQATCTAILQHVQNTLDHSISTRTISRRLVANGLHSCRPIRRLPLTPPNRRQRLEWCRARSTWMTEWHRVVFSDESRFCLSSDSRRVRVWRRRGERSNPAAIVERPPSPLLRIQGTMTAQRYVDDVLRPVTLPYLQGVPNALYQQDNARPHTARISQQALQDVQMLPWPPYSPDLSPIEHVWDIIGRRLHALPQPRSEDELWQMVEREWRAIPQDAIRTLIDSLPRRVAACIAVRGSKGHCPGPIKLKFKGLLLPGRLQSWRQWRCARYSPVENHHSTKTTPLITNPIKSTHHHNSPGLNRIVTATFITRKKWQAIGRMEAGQSQAEVARWLGVTRNVASRLWKKFQTTANVARTPGQGRPRVTTLNQDRYLSLLVRRNRRMTASQLRSDLNAATGVLASTDTIRRRLHKKGLYARRPIICVPLTPPQKRARKLWCRQHVAWNPDEWRRVMFTDESRCSLNSDSRRVFVWREVGTRNNLRNMAERDPYRSQGFMIWAGIFLGGRTALHIFRQGTLTGQRYRDEILAAYVIPQALEMGENFLLMDDNARPHRAGVVDTFLQNHAIARMNWPARSPDLNPFEHVWDNLGRRISSLQPPPRNTHELETALTQEWALIPQELINSLILNLSRSPAELGLRARPGGQRLGHYGICQDPNLLILPVPGVAGGPRRSSSGLEEDHVKMVEPSSLINHCKYSHYSSLIL
ncbi:hypothetical protein LAZ67_3005028 [Cordylochernes scorpioides]|uniref:Transposase n=1 Tax=Cordylochernes scorpioides TaxID=51811 RepID=A0ABY6KAB3_9ARAC|nr:hypothetical protein LAZ67_3005028 [Cordylochernes scorpioides]